MNRKWVHLAVRLIVKNLLYVLLFIGLGYFALVRFDTLKPRHPLPEIPLVDQFGRTVTLSEFRDQWILVDFWFQGCAPCLAEMKQFPRLLEKYGDRLVILSISIDSESQTRRLLTQRPEPWDFLITDRSSWRFTNDTQREYIRSLGVNQYPTYLLIDPSGRWVASPKSGVLGVENQLGGFPDIPLIIRLVWDKIFLTFGKIIVPLLLLFLAYELYRFFRRSRFRASTGNNS